MIHVKEKCERERVRVRDLRNNIPIKSHNNINHVYIDTLILMTRLSMFAQVYVNSWWVQVKSNNKVGGGGNGNEQTKQTLISIQDYRKLKILLIST